MFWKRCNLLNGERCCSPRSGYQNRAAHQIRLNFNKVPTTAFVSDDIAILHNSLRNLSTKSISVYEALRAAVATDQVWLITFLGQK